MRHLNYCCLLFITVFLSLFGYGQDNWCATNLKNSDPGKLTKQLLETVNARLIDNNGVIVIPVVFHVLYSNSAQNISDARILQQLARINTDFRRLNSDVNNVPTVWSSLAADFKFEFKLACVDPSGNSTTGINRVFRNNATFCPNIHQTDPLCKYDPMITARGGYDAWPTNTYLNIWICDYGVWGKAALPWERFDPPVVINGISYSMDLLDGIVLHYATVGDGDINQHPDFNKGRVLTHEIGHWLGLNHLSGRTTNDPCGGTLGDEVSDTPPQEWQNTGCPTFPVTNTSCGPTTSPGVMFMNYMDNTNDDCKYFFTTGQRNRARSFFSQSGPPETRYTFLSNYFGIKPFSSTPVQAVNNLITVYMSNPACLPVTYTVRGGPATIVSETTQQIVLSVECGSSGTIELTAEAIDGGAVTTAAGNYIDEYSFDFIGTPCELWPKAYGTNEGPERLIKDFQGNLINSAVGFEVNTSSYNHMGVYPPSSQPFVRSLHYTNTGVTNWYSDWDYPLFSLRSGIVQMTNSSISYFVNGVDGSTATIPFSLLPYEEIIGETSNGAIITSYGGDGQILYLHTPLGVTSYNTGSIYYEHSYDLSSDNLFMIQGVNLLVYHFNGSSLVQTFSGVLPISIGFGTAITVGPQNQIYFIDNSGFLKQYNYLSGSTSTVNIPGFNNQNLTGFQPFNTSGYVENKLIVFNQSDNYIYALDLLNMSSSKILTQNFSSSSKFSYTIDNNSLYMSGGYLSNNNIQVKIGNQILPNNIQNWMPVFITKLDLLTDFEFFGGLSKSQVQVGIKNNFPSILLSPNPVNSVLNLKINDDNSKVFSSYKITITNSTGNVVLQKQNYFSREDIDVSYLKAGVYLVTVIDSKMNRSSKTFIKL